MAFSTFNFLQHTQPHWLHTPPDQWRPGTLNRQALYDHADRSLLNPGYHDACRGFAESMLATYSSSWLLNRIAREIPRFALMGFVMYLGDRKDSFVNE